MFNKIILFVITNTLLWRHIYTTILNISFSPTIAKCLQNNSYEIFTFPSDFDGKLGSIEIPEEIETRDISTDYPYKIINNTDVMFISNSTRTCVCKQRQCIQLCSSAVYWWHSNPDESEIFYINMTLTNGSVVRSHVIEDFQPVVYNSFCESSYSLTPELDSENGWTLFENGTLLRHDDKTYLTIKEYCFDLDKDEDIPSVRINPFNCAVANELSQMEVVNNTTMLISIPFFLLTILAYFTIPELLNSHGKCFVSYLSSITLSYSLLSFINLSKLQFDFETCILLGIFSHYLQLAYYTWLGIICYDTWQSCSNLLQNSSYIRYACFGWLTPFIWTMFTFGAQLLHIPNYLKPGITDEHCGLEVSKWSATIYLYGPCLVILIFCLYSFIITSRIITMNEREVQQYHGNCEGHRKRYTLYLRLFIVMGLSWFLDMISYLFAMFNMPTPSCLMEFINSIQGLFIFLNFIGRHRIRNIFKDKFMSLFQTGSYKLNPSQLQGLESSDGSFSAESGRSESVKTDISYLNC